MTSNNNIESALKRARENTETCFSKRFRQNDHHLSTKSPSTLLRQVQASAKYEVWYYSRTEDGEAPYSEVDFTLDNLTLYTIERAQCTTGIDGGQLKVQTVYVDLKHIVSEAKDHGTSIPKDFVGNLYSRCIGLAKYGLLSTKGRPKTVVGVKETQLVVKNLLSMQKRKCYYLQVAACLLILLYSGVRLSSLVPKEAVLEKDWKLLKWKHVMIYRQGRDQKGDILHVKISFQHVKCKDNVMNQADHEFTRTFAGHHEEALDLPTLLVGILDSRGYIEGDIEEWYTSGDMLLAIKEEAKEEPVFCRNNVGGHLATLSNMLWNTQYADHAIEKAFVKANMGNVTAYAIRRNFIQTTQKVVDKAKSAALAGHTPTSNVQYTKYGSTFNALDLVKLITDKKVDDTSLSNDFIHGIQSTASLYQKLSKDEYATEVKPFVKEEEKALEKVKKQLKSSYGSLAKSYHLWTQEDKEEYKSVYKAYKRKQDVARRKAIKKLAEIRKDKALKEMKVDENGKTITETVEESHDEIEFFAEDNQIISKRQQSKTQPRTKDDKRLEFMQMLGSIPKTQLEGPHFCQLCVEDPTISEKLKRIYGHKAHVQHLFQGFLSQSWSFNNGKRRGQHTEVSIFMRQHLPMEISNALQCRMCAKQIKGKQRQNQMRKHIKEHALTAANDLSFEQVKVVIQDYFMQYFDVEWDPSELDKLAEERMLLSE